MTVMDRQLISVSSDGFVVVSLENLKHTISKRATKPTLSVRVDDVGI